MDERFTFNPKKDIHYFAIVTNNSYFSSNKWILKDLFEKSIKAKHGEYSLSKVQFEILSYIIAADETNKRYCRWKNLIAKALKTLVDNKANVERIKKAQKRLESIQNYELSTQYFIGLLRSIGDGIAWWFLDYDKSILRLLAEHSYVSVPQLNRGLEAEINRCTELMSEKIPFILNSITNSLRVGDITIFDKQNNNYKLIEIKAGKMQTARTLRQSKHLALVQEAIDTGKHNIISPEITLEKIMAKKPLLTYIKILENAMNEAKESTFSSRVFDQYLSFSVAYLKNIGDSASPEYQAEFDQISRHCNSIFRKNDDFILPVFPSFFHTVHFSRMLAPYTIFPLDRELRFSLISGEFLVLSLININGLARWLRKRGWEVQVLPIPKDSFNLSEGNYHFVPVLQIRKPNSRIGIVIPLEQLCEAAIELWMPESFEILIQSILDHGYSKNAYTVSFPNVGKYAWD